MTINVLKGILNAIQKNLNVLYKSFLLAHMSRRIRPLGPLRGVHKGVCFGGLMLAH